MDNIAKYHKILMITSAPHMMNAVKANVQQKKFDEEAGKPIFAIQNMFKKETNQDGATEYEIIGGARKRFGGFHVIVI